MSMSRQQFYLIRTKVIEIYMTAIKERDREREREREIGMHENIERNKEGYII